ncbi:1608_t:CDS:10, partial [Funneliformis geosporum]
LHQVCAYTTTVYTDNEFTGLHIQAIQSYSDGTALIKLGNSDLEKKGILVIRLLHLNGSMTAFDIQPRCDRPPCPPRWLYPLGSNYIFVTYMPTNLRDTYGLVVDWNGKIISSDIPLGLTDYNDHYDNYGQALTKAFQPNIDPNENFLWTNSFNYKFTNSISWMIFSAPNASGVIDLISQGVLSISNTTILVDFKPFSTIEGGFGLAYLTRVPILSNLNDAKVFQSSKPQWHIYVTFMKPGSADFSEPALIYQTTIPLSWGLLTSCFTAVDASGYGCIYRAPWVDVRHSLISFHSSGSVSVVEQIIVPSHSTKLVLGVTPLPFGGFLTATEDAVTSTKKVFVGKVSQSNGTVVSETILPTNPPNYYGVFPNNTLYVLSNTNDNFAVNFYYDQFIEIYCFLDNGFGNLLIDSVQPTLQSLVDAELRNISIFFRQEVRLSDKNVSIYQYTTTEPLLRQTFAAQSQYCLLLNDNKTVSFQVLSSTFNSPRSSYFVIMNNNFVSSMSQNQAITGVSEGYWTYTTATTTGLLWLTPEGSTFFNNLGKEDKEAFFNEILSELSEVIPIDIERLSTSKHHQPDPKATNQIRFPITIESTKDPLDRTVQQVISDLDTLIKNKEVSPISFKKFASYLDSTYGFQPTPNLWESYKLKLIYVAIGVIILGAIYYMARLKNQKGQNFVIIKVTLMLVDLILDIAFVVTNGKDVSWLYWPSILYLAIPLCFNSLITIILLTSEINENEKFHLWFRSYSKPAAFLTILAATDVEAITLMSSKLFGFQIFSAPFSTKVETWTFWAGFCNLFIEDAPQLIIQILYRQFTVSYDIIPLLTLTMSSIILISNVIGHVYNGIHKCNGHRFNLVPSVEAKKDEI